jgi:biopolymer transport protein ExbD
MIDMTFLLLIFFMVTTRITDQQRLMEVDLPIVRHAAIPEDLSDREIINLDPTGGIFLGERPADMPALKDFLRRRYIEFPPLRLYIRADRRTPARRIKEVMTAAAEAGALEVIFGSQKQRD